MIRKTSWSTEDLQMLRQVDNHKIMYDGYEYYWLRKLEDDWEYYRDDEKYIIIEMNFTRFYKDSTVMGDKFRKATYILRKSNENLRISAAISKPLK